MTDPPRRTGSGYQGGRSLALDVLRCVAVLLVLFHHLPGDWSAALPLPDVLLDPVRRGGWIGVDLFFVLSGFLIAGLLFREQKNHGTIKFRHFFLRRGLKIYPAFLVYIGAVVAVRFWKTGQIPANTWKELLFVQNYLGGFWNHTWSLAVEEHFYLLLPLLLVTLLRFSKAKGSPAPFRSLPGICATVFLVVLAIRVAKAVWIPFSLRTHFCPTESRIDSLMFGVLLAYAHHYHHERFVQVGRRFTAPLLAVGVLFLAPPFFMEVKDSPFIYTIGFTLAYLGSGAILCAFIARGVPDVRAVRALGYCGSFSYSIYLWHPAVMHWGSRALERLSGRAEIPPGLGVTVYLVGSLVVGIVLSRLIEFPIVRLRDRLLPSRSGSPVSEDPPGADRSEALAAGAGPPLPSQAAGGREGIPLEVPE